MPLITAEEARRHVRGEPADDAELELLARAAERMAMQFMNRKVYATQGELDEAQVAAEAELEAALTRYDEARAADYSDIRLAEAAWRAARIAYSNETEEARTALRGMVIVEDVKIAMLLLVGHLFMNREAVTAEAMHELPLGVQSILYPYRVGLGV